MGVEEGYGDETILGVVALMGLQVFEFRSRRPSSARPKVLTLSPLSVSFVLLTCLHLLLPLMLELGVVALSGAVWERTDEW
jgi:hypothetical protein